MLAATAPAKVLETSRIVQKVIEVGGLGGGDVRWEKDGDTGAVLDRRKWRSRGSHSKSASRSLEEESDEHKLDSSDVKALHVLIKDLLASDVGDGHGNKAMSRASKNLGKGKNRQGQRRATGTDDEVHGFDSVRTGKKKRDKTLTPGGLGLTLADLDGIFPLSPSLSNAHRLVQEHQNAWNISHAHKGEMMGIQEQTRAVQKLNAEACLKLELDGVEYVLVPRTSEAMERTQGDFGVVLNSLLGDKNVAKTESDHSEGVLQPVYTPSSQCGFDGPELRRGSNTDTRCTIPGTISRGQQTEEKISRGQQTEDVEDSVLVGVMTESQARRVHRDVRIRWSEDSEDDEEPVSPSFA